MTESISTPFILFMLGVIQSLLFLIGIYTIKALIDVRDRTSRMETLLEASIFKDIGRLDNRVTDLERINNNHQENLNK